MIDKPTDTTEQTQVDAVKQRIRKILAELKALSKSEVSEQQFLEQLSDRTLQTTGAAGFTIWQIDEEGGVSVVHEAGLTSNSSDLDATQLSIHERLVRTVVVSGRPTLIEPDARDQNTGDVLNPMASLLLLKPLIDPSLHHQYVLELFQRPDIAAAARAGYMRYLEEIGEIFTAWQARHQLRFQTSRQSQQQRVLDFVREIHGSLDPSEVSYAAANDGRVLVGCDRLSVHSFDTRKCKVLSVSGQDDFDNRSNVVTKQEELATLVCRSGQPIWVTGQSEGLPQVIRDRVDDYLNESHSRTLGVLPLFDGKNDIDEDADMEDREPVVPTGALIVEWFSQDVRENQANSNVQVLTDHVGRALSNSQTHKGIFLLPLWQVLGKWKWLIKAKTLPKTIAAAIALGLLTLFFCFFPWTFNMRVEGVLQPVEQKNVFANIEAVVSKVHVTHKQEVKKGQLLITLRKDELTTQLQAAEGQLKEVQQEIKAGERAFLAASRETGNAEQVDMISSQLAKLDERYTTVKAQRDSLLSQSEKLKIVSPIDGTVVSWDPVRQLTERPVGRQEVLLVIAAVDSEWHMELFIPERKYGHVVNADRKFKKNDPNNQLDITFFSATDPNKSYKAKVRLLESHASEHPVHGSTVRAFAEFDVNGEQPDLYVGAAVTAKIHCGRKAAGYSWFHELFEFVQSQLLF